MKIVVSETLNRVEVVSKKKTKIKLEQFFLQKNPNGKMLEKHETYNLNKKRRGQQSYGNRLYGRKKWKHLRCVIIPALFLLCLLFILVNVDFTNKIYNKNINKETNSIPVKYFNATKCKFLNSNVNKSITQVLQSKTTTESSRSIELLEITNSRHGIRNEQNNQSDQLQVVVDKPQVRLAGVIGCTEYIENCTLYCIDGSLSYIDENLDKLQSKCKNNDLSLIVQKCEFALGLLQQSFFFGSFSLGYFSINECNLKTIKAATFKHNNAKNIQTLIMRNNQLISLDAPCLDGLTNLINFEFVQMPLSEAFKGNGFLKPLTDNLQKAVLQPIVNGTEVVDPLVWWQDLKMITLITLDLSNTYLQGSLNSNTFQAFETLEYLSLYNCNLFSITAETFEYIFDTLKYLDLRYNHIQTLDYEFLQKFASSSIELDLNLNVWHCDCDNEMLQYFIEHDSQLADGIVCSAPEKWQQMKITQVVEECRESEITSTLTISTTNTTTTAKTTQTVTTSNSSNTKTTTPIKPPFTTEVTIYTSTTTKQSIIPPTVPPYLLLIKCYSNKENQETFSKFIAKPNGNLSIFSTSPGRVQINIIVTSDIQEFNLIYFINYSDYKTKEIDSSNLLIFINDLQLSQAYAFCLVAESASTVSPFDCLGYYVLGVEMKTSWLFTSDKVWFIAASLIIALLLLLLALILVFILLRHNPHWLLQRSKRILQVRNSSRKVLLISKKTHLTATSPKQSPLSQRSSNYLKTLPPIQETEYYDIESSLYSSQLTVPTVNAPILIPLHQAPKARISRKLYNSSYSPANKCRSNLAKTTSQNMDVIENDPDYQSINYYETVN